MDLTSIIFDMFTKGSVPFSTKVWSTSSLRVKKPVGCKGISW